MSPYIARIFTFLNILIFCNDCKFKNDAWKPIGKWQNP